MRCSVTGLSFSLLIFLPSVLIAGTTMSVEVSDTAPSQGSLVSIKVPHTNCTPEIYYQSTRVPLFSGKNHRTGILGIDLETEPNPTTLIVKSGNCDSKDQFPIERKIIVQEGNFEVEHLSIEDREKVVLSEKSLKRHRRESEKINQALARRTPVRHWTSDFHPPVKDSRFISSNNFGSRRIINGRPRSPHSGEDYPAENGDPIYTINHGQVVLTGNFFFSGKSVFVDHGHGLFSMYFHLNTISVETGEFVRKGEQIGEAGATGRVTGPHLHLGVQWMNARVDPKELYDSSRKLVSN